MQAGYQANLHYYAGVTGRMRVVHWLEGSASRLRDAPAGTVVSIITGRGNHTARGGRGAAQTRRAVLGLLVRHARVASSSLLWEEEPVCERSCGGNHQRVKATCKNCLHVYHRGAY